MTTSRVSFFLWNPIIPSKGFFLSKVIVFLCFHLFKTAYSEVSKWLRLIWSAMSSKPLDLYIDQCRLELHRPSTGCFFMPLIHNIFSQCHSTLQKQCAEYISGCWKQLSEWSYDSVALCFEIYTKMLTFSKSWAGGVGTKKIEKGFVVND